MDNWMVPWSVLRRSPVAESELFIDPIIPTLPDPSAGLKLESSAAHRLVRALVDSGVETFFGIPGGPVSPVFDAILRNTLATRRAIRPLDGRVAMTVTSCARLAGGDRLRSHA